MHARKFSTQIPKWIQFGVQLRMMPADGNGVGVVSTGFWWPWGWSSAWTGNPNCDGTSAWGPSGFWGPNGGVITGTTDGGGFAAAGASE